MTDRDPVMDAQMIAERLTPPMRYPSEGGNEVIVPLTPEQSARIRASLAPSAAILSDELERLRAVLAQVRAANETLRRERIEVEALLGRTVADGELGWAVKVWGGLER